MNWAKKLDQRVPFALKLAGAFIAIIIIGVIVVYILLQGTMVATFQEYSNQTSIIHAQGMAPFYSYYFEQNDNWQGVEKLLTAMNSAHGPLGEHLVLADRTGKVLGPSDSEYVGQVLASSLLNRGAPIMLEGQRVGTLFASLGVSTPPLLETSFLNAIQRSILLAGAAAAGIALIVGFLIIRQMTRPLRQLSFATHKLAAGEWDHHVAIHSRDVIGQLGRDFNTMAQKLHRSEELRQRMIADIAHELRTPLTVLQGNLQGLREGVFDPEPEFFSSLHDECVLLSRLVNDLRDISLAEAGELYLNCQLQNIGPLIDRALKPLHPLFDKQQISLHREIESELPSLWVDSDRIVQILFNLLNNALRYTPEGGTISIGIRRVLQDVQISILDTGSGIAKENLPFIFERFWRGDPSRDRKRGGSGLGLAIVKNLVKAHGGEVWANSEESVGTCFTFSLPIKGPQ